MVVKEQQHLENTNNRELQAKCQTRTNYEALVITIIISNERMSVSINNYNEFRVAQQTQHPGSTIY